MASAILRRTNSYAVRSMVDALRIGGSSRSYAKLTMGADIVSAAPDVSLQKARSWDEGVSSKFSTTALKDIFKVCQATKKKMSLHFSPFFRIFSWILFNFIFTGQESCDFWPPRKFLLLQSFFPPYINCLQEK